jgi:hypothetical protein
MGYGIINTLGGAVGMSFSAGGEYETMYAFVPNFYPTNDIAVTTALNLYVAGRAGIGDGAAVGVRSYIDGGNTTDFGANPGGWGLYVSTSRTTEVLLGYYLSGNGCKMRASWQVTYWGDDGDDGSHSRLDVDVDRALVVYDPGTGVVRHRERRTVLAGNGGSGYADDPIADARELGHTGDLAVLEVSPDELDGSLRVDLASGRLVREPIQLRGPADA